uniref:NADH-ubiquinone oxidoreductase chain 1 n=1 Tax=Gryllotalpa unispina TaxID=263542 RepID=A0A0U1VV95_GRYUN|nr:NADH dehydrogenase subunit 1 [Gryllotalpa unispina]AGO20449.1 NADH dehydrogenase subunit 1 [Gryllotalpa unispina]
MNYITVFVGVVFLILGVLIWVAFLTLLERKVLGYIQIRKGPNKVGFVGLPQPFSDAIKLFTSEQTWPELSNYFLYYFSPVFSLFLSLLVWMVFPYITNLFSFSLGILFFLCCASMGVYGVMIAGWSSNSNYALLGGLRAVAQTISYEVSLVLLLMSFLFMIEGFMLSDFYEFQSGTWFIFFGTPLAMCWFSSSLAETNRTPFDFAEGESELVSGFNVEYSGGGFALIFLAEYASILFMSMMFSVVFLGGDIMTLYFYLKLLFVSFMFVWVRGTLPRFRYDKLMQMAWKSYLPVSLNFLIFFLGVKFLVLGL